MQLSYRVLPVGMESREFCTLLFSSLGKDLIPYLPLCKYWEDFAASNSE